MPDTKPVANCAIVADNDYLLRGVLRSLLMDRGFSVFLAADGAEALEYAKRIVARLVLLDLNMPKINGLCACEQIRRLNAYQNVPIVILTAYDSEDTRLAARRAGATGFFAKPFKPMDLLRAVTPLLDTKSFDGATNRKLRDEQPVEQIWPRREEPLPDDGRTPELSRGRDVLQVYRGDPG